MSETTTLTEALNRLVTTAVGQSADLKIDTPDVRVWLGRTGVVDGEPFDNPVSVEVNAGGEWHPYITIAGDALCQVA